MTIGKNLRIIIAGAAATMAVAAPVAQACFRQTSPTPAPISVDVCKLDVDALLAKYGSNLSAAQKAYVVESAKKLFAAKGCAQTTPPVETPAGPPTGGGDVVPGYGV